ncbi:MAG: Na/Pi cotransporter family protein [Erysipelotrichaceae bacterium]|nr:Na/Pi cotransporter family protein [Erysipelotrichaceae bacterium]
MSIFDVLTLFGGLAMFLYGMRLMGDGLKESSSGTLKKMMEMVTNNPVKAFLLGAAVTAVIQSSTATIVITAGLVTAGIITFRQSLGIVIGANVGTTVTGQIIRLLDLNASAGWLEIFKPSSLAPIALVIGIVLIMTNRFKNAKVLGNIAIGFGILFSGLLNMTNAVDTLSETGVFESLFSSLGSNPFIGYLTGATVAFILQSSSATIGILQAFSASGKLAFNAVYAVIAGVYLGDCVTTAIVCSIGAQADSKRVGMFNILYNLSKTVLVLAGIFVFRKLGLLDGIWYETVNSGRIANANTIFNLASAVILLPTVSVFEKLSMKIIKDEPVTPNPYKDKLDALNPAFFSTPALALRSCYDALLAMFYAARNNVETACQLLRSYDEKKAEEIRSEEENIDLLADRVSGYIGELSGKLTAQYHTSILNEYYKLVVEFERMGDYAMNICDSAKDLDKKSIQLSLIATGELDVLEELIGRILDYTEQAFKKRDIVAAAEIEPFEEVVDDMVNVMRKNHMHRLSKGLCTVTAGADFLDVLHDIERISDICSNVGLATLARVHPELSEQSHDYIYNLHAGNDETFNEKYHQARSEYIGRLNQVIESFQEHEGRADHQ